MLCISRGERHSYICIAVERHTKGQDEYSHHKWAALGTKARTTADEGKVTFFFLWIKFEFGLCKLDGADNRLNSAKFSLNGCLSISLIPPFFLFHQSKQF